MADSDTEEIVDPYSDSFNRKWEATPIRNFKSNRDYIYAMKEDLAEWFNDMYNLDLSADNFLEKLESGVVLCQHANNVHVAALEFRRKHGELTAKNGIQIPEREIRYKPLAPPGTFMARDNISNFIHWCRHCLGVKDVLLFETDDLVLRKNEKSFVLCLLELARRGAKFGMEAPTIIQMETEIEAEIAGHETPIFTQKKTCDMMSLDEMVRDLVGRCTCPVQFPMVRVSDGKYRIGDSNTLIFVRILRSHVMVRVGGGWDTLEHYLDKHDPCRCAGHKSSRHHDPFRRQSSPCTDVKSTTNHSSKLRSSQEYEHSNNKMHHRYHSTGDVNHQNGEVSPRKSSKENGYSGHRNRPSSPSSLQSSLSSMRRAGSSGRINRRDDEHIKSSNDGPLLRQSLENSRRSSPRSSHNSLSQSLNLSGRPQKYSSMNGDADDYEKTYNSNHNARKPRPASPRTDVYNYDSQKRSSEQQYITNNDVIASSFHPSGYIESPSRRRSVSPGAGQRLLSPDSSDSDSSSKKGGMHYCQPSGNNWNNSTKMDYPPYDISGNNRMSLWEKNNRGEGRTLPETPTTPRSSGRSSPSPIAAYIRSGRSSPSPSSRSGRCSPAFYNDDQEIERPKSRGGRSSPAPFDGEKERTARTGRSSPVPSRSSSVPARRDRSSMPPRSSTPVRSSTPIRSSTPTRGGSSFIDRERERKEKIRQERSKNLSVTPRSGRASPSPVERRTETLRSETISSTRGRSGRSSPIPRSSSPAPRPASPRVSSTRPRPAKKKEEEVVLMITRTDQGGHQVIAKEDEEVNIITRRTRDRDVSARPSSPRVSARRSKEDEEREIRRRRCRSVSPERARRNEELSKSSEVRGKSDRNPKRYRSKTPEPRDFDRRESNETSLYQRQRNKKLVHNAMTRYLSGSNVTQDAYDSDDEADDSSNSSDQKRTRVKFNESLNGSIRHSALRPCSPVPTFHKLAPKFHLPKRVDPYPNIPTKIPKPIFQEKGYKKTLSGSTSNLSKLRNRASSNQRTRTTSKSSISSNSTIRSHDLNVYDRNYRDTENRFHAEQHQPQDEIFEPKRNSIAESTVPSQTKNNDEFIESLEHSAYRRSISQESGDVFLDEKPSPTTNGHGMDSGFEDSFHQGHYPSINNQSSEKKQPPINMAAPLVTGRSTIIRSSSTSSTSASTEIGPIRPVTPTLERFNLEELGVYDSDSTDTEYF
ncbi:uncharacterized protein LOC144449063 [Glandiceps talaboti]